MRVVWRKALRDDLLAANLNVTLVNAGDYKFKTDCQ